MEHDAHGDEGEDDGGEPPAHFLPLREVIVRTLWVQ